jgi:hypothetical protein
LICGKHMRPVGRKQKPWAKIHGRLLRGDGTHAFAAGGCPKKRTLQDANAHSRIPFDQATAIISGFTAGAAFWHGRREGERRRWR